MAIFRGTDATNSFSGTRFADRLFGEGGNDSLWGKEGNDYIDGGTGNDTLGGGKGDDTLIGGIGNDRLMGKAGADRLTGGEGADTFGLGLGYGESVDIITDFDVTEGDRLQLASQIDFYVVQATGIGGSDTAIAFFEHSFEKTTWLGAVVLEGGNFNHLAINGNALRGWPTGV